MKPKHFQQHLVASLVLAGAALPVAAFAQLPGMGTEALPAPVQPDTVDLPAPAAPQKEVWHLDDGRFGVRNVTRPTLTAFRPAGHHSRAAVIIAPGGAFLGLEMEKEGWDAARWFANHGITAFVLKYRTLPTPADQKVFVAELDKMIHGQKAVFAPPGETPKDALDDGIAALRHVRAHAAAFDIDPHKIGFMGFSAGGFLSRSVVEKGGADKPDFIAPIYPNMGPMVVPADAPPMFVAIAADDFLLARTKGLPLIESYRDAGKSVEFHMFSTGGHGFSVGPAGSPEQGWMDVMLRWLHTRGFVESAN